MEVVVGDFLIEGPLVDLSCQELQDYADAVSRGLPYPLLAV